MRLVQLALAQPASQAALREDTAARLWEVSQRLTGVSYGALSQPGAHP